MRDANGKLKKESNKVYDGNWNFINPRWILFLMVLFFAVQAGLYKLVGYSGIRITDDIIIKRAIMGAGDIITITGNSVAVTIIHLVLIIGIIYISVRVLPADKKHDSIRLAGIFVMTGSLFKISFALVNIEMALWIEIGGSFRMPMLICADLYTLGGLIAILVLFTKKYSNQEIEEIILSWKTSRKKKK